ncbi:xanthine dehydrogenase accessory protein XdhC [Psychrobacter arenosus]|uniref:xanthine dehydrogenase accessory protein XdhC n=1 Tax=Psychrobacter arenosus TaxID=256326 RepID=UPI001D127029|nr:xanthine dehydrogenase accessory protein XdhC [Psychrobacter arenosus]
MSDLFQSPKPFMRWYEGLAHYQQHGVAHVLASIVAVNGSAPRALQAKMVITEDAICDTLGGGGLEHDVTATARQLLSGESIAAATKKEVEKTDKSVRREAVYSKHYPLGAKLGQCCGGSVTVMFECFNIKPPMSLLVFGAGHVAGALMTILSELPCQVDWVDSRPEMFNHYKSPKNSLSKINSSKEETYAIDELETKAIYQLPAHIRPHVCDEPIDFIYSHGQGRYVLVMTHDHSLDFELVRAALDVNNATNSAANANNASVRIPYIGCIGSATKAKRFKDRLSQRGYDTDTVNSITMPIGLEIGGKEPMAVAVSIAAQILQHYHQQYSIEN